VITKREHIEDTVAFSLVAGMGLALLFGGFIPMIKGGGEARIYEKNKTILWAETIGVGAITVFGAYKLVKKLNNLNV